MRAESPGMGVRDIGDGQSGKFQTYRLKLPALLAIFTGQAGSVRVSVPVLSPSREPI